MLKGVQSNNCTSQDSVHLFFNNTFDNEQYLSIYKILESIPNLTTNHNIPSTILQLIAYFATGTFVTCKICNKDEILFIKQNDVTNDYKSAYYFQMPFISQNNDNNSNNNNNNNNKGKYAIISLIHYFAFM